jgi:hypothetical protein
MTAATAGRATTRTSPRSRWSRLSRIVAAAVVAGAVLGATSGVDIGHRTPARALAAVAGTSTYLPIGPVRLADTRAADCGCTRIDPYTIRVQVAGRFGVAPGATAVAITITATDARDATYLTAFPAGSPRPGTSTVNVGRGRTVANSAIVPLSVGGAVDVFSPAEVQMVVDISGVFVTSTSASAGRFVPVAPVRLLDTRSTSTPLRPGDHVDVPLPSSLPVDAQALIVNVTSVNSLAAGFVTAYAAGTERPNSSVLNPDGSGAAIAASVIVPASEDGITVFSSGATDLAIDLVGWFTGPSAGVGTDGLFVPVAPTRLLDTRDEGPRLWTDGGRELAVAVPGAAAIVTNLTLDLTDAAGFVTAFPAGTGRPPTSSINARARNATVANAAIVGLSTRGMSWYSNAGTDLIVDMTGWFTGTPVAATEQPLPNEPVEPRVLLVGDSTLAALDVVTASQRALQGMVPVLEAAPCRRLVRPSCKSAFTGQVPDTAVQAIGRTAGSIDVVVVKAGYNEGTSGFQQSAELVLGAARAHGARVVVWLTYSEGTGSQLRTYTVNNAVLTSLRDGGAWPELVIADWRTYASSSRGWYAGDRVHLQGLGAWATADYVARWVASALHRPCPQPWAPGADPERRCTSPDDTASRLGPPDLRGLYGL